MHKCRQSDGRDPPARPPAMIDRRKSECDTCGKTRTCFVFAPYNDEEVYAHCRGCLATLRSGQWHHAAKISLLYAYIEEGMDTPLRCCCICADLVKKECECSLLFNDGQYNPLTEGWVCKVCASGRDFTSSDSESSYEDEDTSSEAGAGADVQ
jgi:hypothetical protein